MLRVMVACLGVGVLGAASAGDLEPSEPRSNFIARVKVLERSPLGVTIEHSDKGRREAFRFAGEWCAAHNKIAVYQRGARGWGPDTVSTWSCIAAVPQTP